MKTILWKKRGQQRLSIKKKTMKIDVIVERKARKRIETDKSEV